jgi:hypothetical protein
MSIHTPQVPLGHIAGAAVRAERTVGRAAGNPWIERFARFGLIVRGIIYFVPGVLALQLALGTHGAVITQTGAIERIGEQPYGRVLLVAIAVGLAGYSLWGVIRAVFDPLRKGHEPPGLAKRFGFAMSALAYASLLAATVRYLAAGGQTHVTSPHDWTIDLLAHPMGAWLVGIIGLIWIAGAGIGEMVRGWRGSFVQDLDVARMSAAERRWATDLGHIGITARGCVFTIIGVLLVAVARHASPGHGYGMDAALLALADQPYGRVLVGVAGLGLIAFGVFSAMCARWMRMRVAEPTPMASPRSRGA